MRPDIEGMERRCAAATKPPWENHSGMIFAEDIGGYRLKMTTFPVAQVRGWGHLQYREDGEAKQDANADFLAHSREDLQRSSRMSRSWRGRSASTPIPAPT
jgi:hypothetical protein